MDKILSQCKKIEMETKKSLSWKEPMTRKQRYYTHVKPKHRPRRRPRPKVRVVEVPKKEREQEYRRKQLEHYLSNLRAMHEPTDSIEIIEDFLDNFEPRNKEEEMMASSVQKQLDRVKEMTNNVEV